MSIPLPTPSPALSPTLSPADAGFIADPYPTYAAWRSAGPVHWSDEFFGGAWLVTRHADVDAVLRDSVRFSAQRTGGWVMDAAGEARAELKGFQALFARAMLFVDAPDHARLRGAMNAGFRPEAIERLRPCVERWVDERLDAVEAQVRSDEGVDVIEAIARPLPARAIAALLGVEDNDEDGAAQRSAFVRWSDDIAAFIGALQPSLDQARRAQTSLIAMAAAFEPLVAARRASPRDDLVSRLAQAADAGRIDAGAELLAQCAMLLFAGHETTRNGIGNGLRALLADPALRARLRADPALLPGAVRELLRYDSPVQYTGRRVAADLELHGQALRRGDLVIALIGSANRDPLRFDRPDQLDPARRGGLPLSFGSGPHVCIGAALTLMEMQAVFAALLRRWPGLGLVEPAAQWLPNPVYRGLRTLRVRAAAGV